MKQRGYAPSMREIGDLVNLSSPSSVKHQLEVLEAKGYLRRDPHTPRAIEVINPDADVPQLLRDQIAQEPKPRYIPLVGRVAGGVPIMAEEMVEGVFPFPRDFVGTGEVFMLRVKGDSMIGAAINDGDYVIVRRQPDAEEGQIVAVQIEDEATVKTYSLVGKRAYLKAENPAYEPIEAHKVHILGRVICVVRQL
jgi:repressor LexA